MSEEEQPTNPEEKIFEDALKIEAGDKRDAFLDGACRGDQKLRAQLNTMLEANDGADGFLDTLPDLATQADPSPEAPPFGAKGEGPGTQIGKYKLLQQIGVGGMGVVYMAEQEGALRRKVAFKIIKLGMDTKNVVARFEAERQALALMDHRNIAKVFDAGATDTGRPYFVMELVKGIPITEYCDKHKLSTEKRLELFIPVCEAIQHAHHKGIIHRDIKPSNVLVAHFDGKPVPMVIDFGIAKATNQRLTEKTQFTEHGQFIGTLEYVSPEQAEGSQLDIDTRSDIYSLGVLLYQLLTGSTPFPSKTLQKSGWREMMRIIQEDTPPLPSHRLSTMSEEEQTTVSKTHPEGIGRMTLALRRELDWLVMKCLEKDRARRYETANGLAMDIGRYLNGEAINAVPPSKGYLLGKLVHKYKKAFAMAAAIAVILAVSAVVSTVLWRKSEAAEQLASDKAERLAAFNDWMTRHLLPQVDAWTGFEAGQNRNVDIKLKDAIVASVKTLSEDFKDQPVIEGEIRLTVGRAFESMGMLDESTTNLFRAYELFREILGETHTNTISAKFEWGQVHGNFGQWKKRPEWQEGLDVIKEVLEVARNEFGKTNILVIRLEAGLSSYYGNANQVDDAEAAFSQMNQLLEKGPSPTGLLSENEWLRFHGSLAWLRWSQRRIAEGHTTIERIWGAMKDDPKHNQSIYVAATVLHLRSWWFRIWDRDFESARRDSKTALDISLELVGAGAWPTPQLYWYHAVMEHDAGNQDEAIASFLEGAKGYAEMYGPTHQRTAGQADSALGIIAYRGAWREAAGLLERLREENGYVVGKLLAGEMLVNQILGENSKLQELRHMYFTAQEEEDQKLADPRAVLAVLMQPCTEDELRILNTPKLSGGLQMGLLPFRQEKWELAEKRLRPLIDNSGITLDTLVASYALAMIQKHHGEHEGAVSALVEANRVLQDYLDTGWCGKAYMSSGYGTGWEFALCGLLLREEAEQMIYHEVRSQKVDEDTLKPRRKQWREVRELKERGDRLARQRRYEEALTVYEDAMAHPAFRWSVAQHEWGIAYRLLTMYWALGREVDHRSVLAKLHEGVGTNRSPHLSQLAEFPGKLPLELEVRRTESVDRIELERKWDDPNETLWNPELISLGMALYREDKFQRSLDVLEELTSSTRYREPVIACAFSAMARSQLGGQENQDIARELLARADALFQERVEPGDGMYPHFFPISVMMEMVIKEADGVIAPDQKNAPYVHSLPENGFPPQRTQTAQR